MKYLSPTPTPRGKQEKLFHRLSGRIVSRINFNRSNVINNNSAYKIESPQIPFVTVTPGNDLSWFDCFFPAPSAAVRFYRCSNARRIDPLSIFSVCRAGRGTRHAAICALMGIDQTAGEPDWNPTEESRDGFHGGCWLSYRITINISIGNSQAYTYLDLDGDGPPIRPATLSRTHHRETAYTLIASLNMKRVSICMMPIEIQYYHLVLRMRRLVSGERPGRSLNWPESRTRIAARSIKNPLEIVIPAGEKRARENGVDWNLKRDAVYFLICCGY